MLLGLWCDFYTRFALSMAQRVGNTENFDSTNFFASLGTALQAHNAPLLLAHTQTLTSLAGAWQFTPLQAVQQVALLPMDAVLRICLFAALSIHYKTLSKIIIKKHVLSLLECVGQEAWHFGLRKAMLYKGDALEPHFHIKGDVSTQLAHTCACVLDFCLSIVPKPLAAHPEFVALGYDRRPCPALNDVQSRALQSILCRIARNDVPTPWKELF